FEKGVTENLNEFQEASDSRIDIDGVQDIQKDTNTLDDVISGVTITLKKAHDDPINDTTTLSIKRDNNTIIAAVEAFISTYNGMIDFYQKNQVYDQDSGTAGPLLGDATANLIRNRLASLIKTPVAGSDVIRTFSDLGIAFDSNGKLELDTTILNEKLNNDPDDTAQFFTQTDAGAEGFALRMVNELEAMLQTSNGILSIRQDGIQKSIEDVQDDIEKVEYRVTASEERMRAQFTALEVLLSQYQATSDYLSQQLVSLQNMNSYIANKK
nr:flagellar filament capping protein FliD [Desulfobacterales bacterium]